MSKYSSFISPNKKYPGFRLIEYPKSRVFFSSISDSGAKWSKWRFRVKFAVPDDTDGMGGEDTHMNRLCYLNQIEIFAIVSQPAHNICRMWSMSLLGAMGIHKGFTRHLGK